MPARCLPSGGRRTRLPRWVSRVPGIAGPFIPWVRPIPHALLPLQRGAMIPWRHGHGGGGQEMIREGGPCRVALTGARHPQRAVACGLLRLERDLFSIGGGGRSCAGGNRSGETRVRTFRSGHVLPNTGCAISHRLASHVSHSLAASACRASVGVQEENSPPGRRVDLSDLHRALSYGACRKLARRRSQASTCRSPALRPESSLRRHDPPRRDS